MSAKNQFEYQFTVKRRSGISSIYIYSFGSDAEAEQYAMDAVNIDTVLTVKMERRKVGPWRKRLMYGKGKS